MVAESGASHRLWGAVAAMLSPEEREQLLAEVRVDCLSHRHWRMLLLGWVDTSWCYSRWAEEERVRRQVELPGRYFAVMRHLLADCWTAVLTVPGWKFEVLCRMVLLH